MADNTRLDPGADGDLAVTREISHAGDMAKLAGSFLMGITGTEGAYTAEAIGGDAANGIDVDVTRVQGTVTVDGSGVTQPVSASSLPLPSGASTAANQSTANSTLSAIAGYLDTEIATIVTAVQLLDNIVSGSEAQVDVVSSALPTGAATAANQSTANSSLADIKAAVEILDNIVSGSEAQVDVVAALPAGTNLIGQTTPAASASATGTATFYDPDLDETKQEVTDNANVRIYSITAFNMTDAPLFLQLFDADADSVTVGTTAPTNQYVIPGNANSDGAGFNLNFAVPKSYSTGFTVACTTDSEGSSAPGAGACQVNIEYISAA